MVGKKSKPKQNINFSVFAKNKKNFILQSLLHRDWAYKWNHDKKECIFIHANLYSKPKYSKIEILFCKGHRPRCTVSCDRPGICVKYFLSFPQKNQRKLRQTKCLLFNFWPKKAILHLVVSFFSGFFEGTRENILHIFQAWMLSVQLIGPEDTSHYK